MKDYSSFKKRALQNEEIRKEYDKLQPEFAIISAIIKNRIEKGLTQAELAKKMGTKQSAISRLESGTYNPSLAFLEKLAKALDVKLKISFF